LCAIRSANATVICAPPNRAMRTAAATVHCRTANTFGQVDLAEKLGEYQSRVKTLPLPS
jgi:hypothetical protein